MVRLLYLHYPTQFETVGNIRFKMKKTPHVFTGFTPLMLCTSLESWTHKEVLNRKSVVLPGAAYDIRDRPDLLSISMKTFFWRRICFGSWTKCCKVIYPDACSSQTISPCWQPLMLAVNFYSLARCSRWGTQLFFMSELLWKHSPILFRFCFFGGFH